MSQNIHLPDTFSIWKTAETGIFTTDSELYDYINGGAELYLSFGFQSLYHKIFSAPGQPDIIVDIFELGSAKDAFGLFSHSREMIDNSYGQGSQYTAGLLLFWKNNFLVSILASPETKESKKTIHEIASYTSGLIKKEGKLPSVLNLLPELNLVPESIRFFRNHVWINSFYYIASENILHINENTDAVLAKYVINDTQHFVLIIKYQNENDALQARHSFSSAYLPSLQNNKIVKTQENTWTGCVKYQNYNIIVFNAVQKEAVENLIKTIKHRIKKNEE